MQTSLKIHLNYGKNRAKLVRFKRQKVFCFAKRSSLARFRHSINAAFMHFTNSYSEAVEQSPHHTKVKGLSLATTVDTVTEKIVEDKVL